MPSLPGRPPTPASLPSPNRLHKFLLPLGDLNSQFRTRAHGGWHGMRVRPVAGLERKCCLHVMCVIAFRLDLDRE
jgi:hypothetical protein